jgi:hypothetical protein
MMYKVGQTLEFSPPMDIKDPFVPADRIQEESTFQRADPGWQPTGAKLNSWKDSNSSSCFSIGSLKEAKTFILCGRQWRA